MTDEALLADQFTAARPRLVRVAYAILGSHSEAEDVVAETWLRLVAADAGKPDSSGSGRPAPVRDVEGWAIVAVGRAALDAYRSARRRREVYVGPWLPEPLVAEPVAGGLVADPADRVTLDDSVSFALLVVLETLSPAERTSWVLHDLFDLPFNDVARVVGRTPESVRQLAFRARAHLRDRAPRFPIDPMRHRQTVDRFLAATAGGRLADLLAVLDPDVALISDGGGQVSAARRPVQGAHRVARLILGASEKFGALGKIRVVDVNGVAGLAYYPDGRLAAVGALTVDGDRISRIDIVMAPRKLPGTASCPAPAREALA